MTAALHHLPTIIAVLRDLMVIWVVILFIRGK